MLACESQHWPRVLPSDSDTESAEPPPWSTARALGARAPAATLTAGAAALVLLAVAGRGGTPARVVAAAWREAIVEASDSPSACVLYGGLHVRHGSADASVLTWDSSGDVTFVFEGDLWLLRSDTLQIQGHTGSLETGQDAYTNVLKEIAIHGSFVGGNALHISATDATWHRADGSSEHILTDMDSEWSNEFIEATRDRSGDVLQPDRKDAEMNVVHLKLPNSVELEIDQWPEHEVAGHFINVKIIKPMESTDEGLCVDSTVPSVGVSTSESFFHASFHNRICSNVESRVPWPYHGACEDSASESKLASSSAIDNGLTCRSCGQNPFVKFMEKLAQSLKDLKGEECSQGVIYGVAFGAEYEDMLNAPSDSVTQRLLQLHQRCFFYFVNEEKSAVSGSGEPSLDRTSRSGLNILIPVPTSALPYRSMRRNTKLFKMYGGFVVFAFAERLIWQDAKLFKMEAAGTSSWIDAMDYQKMFTENVVKHSACASFRALPNHKSSVGHVRADGARFKYHCSALQSSDRPDVTDDRETIRKQCDHYQSLGTDNGRISLDSGMIDSAVILWDMRSERCRDFNSRLSCTWLGEIQCFGDRDQVSFAEALRAVGVYEPNPVSPRDSMAKDKLFVGVDDPATPLVHIGRGDCHWYFSNPGHNMYTCGSNP